MPADSKSVSRRVFEEIWNSKKLEATHELMTSDYAHHDPQAPVAPKGIEAYKDFVLHFHNAFPDLRFHIEDEFSDGQKVASRWTATATHKGDLSGIAPTGKRISVTGMTIAKVKDGKVIESWSNWDTLGLMQQLGVAPSAGEHAA
jgi:steroid delta-isomerase-like uncharacterized protein